MIELEGDSGDYEFLTEAVELSAGVQGLLCEIGLRMGFGTKTIIDAAIRFRPGSTVISIDPFGSILYTGREPNGPCRLDYTNDMYKRVMSAMSEYVLDKNVNWIPFKMTDERFFETYATGVELYELESELVNKYATVHFDGPHTVAAIRAEIDFFNPRTSPGGCYCFDDVTPDFYDHDIVETYLFELGFELIRKGSKKAIYRKL